MNMLFALIFEGAPGNLNHLTHPDSGLRPGLPDLQEAASLFLVHCRPRGKKLPTRPWEPIQLAEHYLSTPIYAIVGNLVHVGQYIVGENMYGFDLIDRCFGDGKRHHRDLKPHYWPT